MVHNTLLISSKLVLGKKRLAKKLAFSSSVAYLKMAGATGRNVVLLKTTDCWCYEKKNKHCSLYVVDQFHAGHCKKVGKLGENVIKINHVVCQNQPGGICILFAYPFL